MRNFQLKEEKYTKEPIYKNGCWGCKQAQEDPQEKYICPKLEQHWKNYEKQEEEKEKKHE